MMFYCISRKEKLPRKEKKQEKECSKGVHDYVVKSSNYTRYGKIFARYIPHFLESETIFTLYERIEREKRATNFNE